MPSSSRIVNDAVFVVLDVFYTFLLVCGFQVAGQVCLLSISESLSDDWFGLKLSLQVLPVSYHLSGFSPVHINECFVL